MRIIVIIIIIFVAQSVRSQDTLTEDASVKDLLSYLIIKAEILKSSAEEGSEPGNVRTGSINHLSDAIYSAGEILNQDEPEVNDLFQSLQCLIDACVIFEGQYIVPPEMNSITITNKDATAETKYLFINLANISKTSVIFGMHDPVGYGVGWKGDNDRSDIRDVCGSYPALAGWNLTHIARGADFSDDIYRYSKFYNLNGINTPFWVMDNPFGGNFMWSDRALDSNGVAAIIPGGSRHEWYKEQLDNIAMYFHLIKGKNGESIPVIFRPFHEHNHDWFWWGNKQCSVEEYKTLLRFTYDYLVKTKKVNNMLMAYSPGDRFFTEENYLERYPGDDYVDILGFDAYWDLGYQGRLDIEAYVQQTRLLVEIAEARGKIPAVTECGNESLIFDDWFTKIAWGPLAADSVARRIAYLMVWRNADKVHHFAPYPGHASVPDFLKFYNDSATLFMDDMPAIYNRMIR